MYESYPYPTRPFPFPEDLPCGAPYINWPAGKDLVLRHSIDTEVAIPESWIDVDTTGIVNKTKDAYSMIMTRTSSVTCASTKLVSLYRKRCAQVLNIILC